MYDFNGQSLEKAAGAYAEKARNLVLDAIVEDGTTFSRRNVSKWPNFYKGKREQLGSIADNKLSDYQIRNALAAIYFNDTKVSSYPEIAASHEITIGKLRYELRTWWDANCPGEEAPWSRDAKRARKEAAKAPRKNVVADLSDVFLQELGDLDA